jgi:hypothetical protein
MEPVSVESSPVRNEYSLGLERAPRKSRFHAEYDSESHSDSDSDAESVEPLPITPRNLIPEFQSGLNFDFEFDEEQEQPQQPVRTISESMSMSSLTLSNIEESIGECSVCYDALPLHANHVLTVCSHLFCVKCFIRWCCSNSSASCPMCRRPLIVEEEEDEQNEQSEQNEEEEEEDAGMSYEYLHMVEDADLVADTSFEMQTDPEHGDYQSRLSVQELDLIQYNRLVVSCVFLKNRFYETLFSSSVWGCRVQHSLIPKSEWLSIWENVALYTHRAPSQMFEFVIRRNSESLGNNPEEINVFGYIIRPIEITDVVVTRSGSLRNAFGFSVMVTSPTIPLGDHNLTDGRTIQTVLLHLQFEHIRRMYYMTSVETHEV